ELVDEAVVGQQRHVLEAASHGDNIATVFASSPKNRRGPMPTPRWHQPCRRIRWDATPCENHAAFSEVRRSGPLRKESHQKIWVVVAVSALFVRTTRTSVRCAELPTALGRGKHAFQKGGAGAALFEHAQAGCGGATRRRDHRPQRDRI